MIDAELTAYVNFCRTKVAATRIGPLHGMWDVIFDGEAAVVGRKTICSRKDIEETLFGYVHDEVLRPYKELQDLVQRFANEDYSAQEQHEINKQMIVVSDGIRDAKV